MTVQRKIDGSLAADRLRDPDGPRVAARIAGAIWMLHARGVTPVRSHAVDDELRILAGRLAEVRDRLGARRVDNVLRGCELLAEEMPSSEGRPIHRDFYPAQVLVEPERVWLIDLDLYCAGDPALDVGNFLAHMIEERVRRNGSAEGLTETESAFESRYVELAGRQALPSIRAFTTLSLARHVYLSTQFPERQHTTPALLDLCERRLSAGIESRRYA